MEGNDETTEKMMNGSMVFPLSLFLPIRLFRNFICQIIGVAFIYTIGVSLVCWLRSSVFQISVSILLQIPNEKKPLKWEINCPFLLIFQYILCKRKWKGEYKISSPRTQFFVSFLSQHSYREIQTYMKQWILCSLLLHFHNG